MNAAVETKTKEELLAIFSEYDFIFVIDKSGSMSTEDAPNGRSRYEYVQESIEALARDICKIDSDGVGLVLFGGSSIVSQDNCNADKVRDVFANNRPGGGTPLHLALDAGLKLAGKSDKKDFLIVVTDGTPDDERAAAQVIINQANGQETDDACTILFIQVGRDARATEYLRKLDDNLTGAKFDIVDVKTIDEVEAFPSTAHLIAAAIVG
jgi:Mg-chelatase subunit ChlD